MLTSYVYLPEECKQWRRSKCTGCKPLQNHNLHPTLSIRGGYVAGGQVLEGVDNLYTWNSDVYQSTQAGWLQHIILKTKTLQA